MEPSERIYMLQLGIRISQSNFLTFPSFLVRQSTEQIDMDSITIFFTLLEIIFWAMGKPLS